jgi:hypothetical protein
MQTWTILFTPHINFIMSDDEVAEMLDATAEATMAHSMLLPCEVSCLHCGSPSDRPMRARDATGWRCRACASKPLPKPLPRSMWDVLSVAIRLRDHEVLGMI